MSIRISNFKMSRISIFQNFQNFRIFRFFKISEFQNFSKFQNFKFLATTIGYGRNVPETDAGKGFCIAFIIMGIPYFAYMISSISDDINCRLTRWKIEIETTKGVNVAPYWIMICYTFVGCLMLILVPSCIFHAMEGIWDLEKLKRFMKVYEGLYF